MNTTDESITNAYNEKSEFNFNHAIFDIKIKDKILSSKSISHITSFSYESLFFLKLITTNQTRIF